MELLPDNPDDLTLEAAENYVLSQLPVNATRALRYDATVNRQRGGRPQASVKIVALRRVEQDAVLLEDNNLFFYKRYQKNAETPSPTGIVNPRLVNVDNLDAIDWSLYGENDTVACFDADQNTFLFARLSPRVCQELSGQQGSRQELMRDIFRLARRIKPNVGRGAQRSGVSTYYKCFGWRKGYDLLPIGLYSYLRIAMECQKEWMESNLRDYVLRMERTARSVLVTILTHHWLMQLFRYIGLPSYAHGSREHGPWGIFMQFSVATDGYWSNIHVDTDYGFTMTGCISENADRRHDVVYNFCFPSHAAHLPMKSGHAIIFDARVPHGSTNPACAGDYIYSAYVSQRTVLYKMLEFVENIISNAKN